MAYYNITREDCSGLYLWHTEEGIRILEENEIQILDIEEFEDINYEDLMDIYVEDYTDEPDWWEFVESTFQTNNRGISKYSNITWIVPTGEING